MTRRWTAGEPEMTSRVIAAQVTRVAQAQPIDPDQTAVCGASPTRMRDEIA